jgi:hypothetical protein
MVCSPSADRSSQIIYHLLAFPITLVFSSFRPSKRSIHHRMTWLPPTRSYHIKTKYPHPRPTRTIPSVVPDFIVIPFIPHAHQNIPRRYPGPSLVSRFDVPPSAGLCSPRSMSTDRPTDSHRCVLRHIRKCILTAASLISSAFVFFLLTVGRFSNNHLLSKRFATPVTSASWSYHSFKIHLLIVSAPLSANLLCNNVTYLEKIQYRRTDMCIDCWPRIHDRPANSGLNYLFRAPSSPSPSESLRLPFRPSSLKLVHPHPLTVGA